MIEIATPAGPVYLRATTDDDAEFQFRLFCLSREELSATLGALPGFDLLMRMQFRAQSHSYAAHYPNAELLVIAQASQKAEPEPIGRVVVDWSGRELRLIDIALVPQRRNLGVGAAVIGHFQRAASARQALMRLSVARSNAAAERLYRRLGFNAFTGDEVYAQLEWSANGEGL